MRGYDVATRLGTMVINETVAELKRIYTRRGKIHFEASFPGGSLTVAEHRVAVFSPDGELVGSGNLMVGAAFEGIPNHIVLKLSLIDKNINQGAENVSGS